MERQLRMGGGIMGLEPRQQYGLGSFVKKAVKGVKSAVKGVANTVKENPMLALAALNFAPMIGGGSPFIGFGKGAFQGSLANLPSFSKALKLKEGADFANTAKVFAGGSALAGLLSQAEQEGDPEGITRNVGALKLKLADAYRNQRTFADAEDEEAAIAQQVALDTAEYNQDMARGMANGGRIGFNNGSEDYGKLIDAYERGIDVMPGESLTDYINRIRESERKNSAMGGRIGYAFGTPEQNAIQAAGIEGLPLNQNPAGVTELDLRETGGFIPPVGVKEKADDIPAMLANNEFVFTADAVRGMGDGNINKGAQRMYDMMKKLEKGGRV